MEHFQMKKFLMALMGLLAFTSFAVADSVLVIDAQYDQVTNNVKGRLEAAGHTVTTTTDVSQIPTVTTTYQQVWDLRYSAALTSGEQTAYQTYVTNGGFAYFVTENPGCCQSRNNSVAALITNLGGGTTTIGANYAMTNNVSSNVNTTYMTPGITVNYAAVSAIVNSQGIPLISDGSGAVSGMSWIGRAGALGSGVTGTIVTVADTNWLDQARFNTSGTTAQQQNVTALDDIIRGIVAGTVAGTISANGNGAGSQQQNQAPTVVSTAPGTPRVTSSAANGTAINSSASTRGTTTTVSNVTTAPTVYTSSARDAATKNAKTIEVTRTTTVVGTTPRTTINTATTPVTTVTTTTTPRTTTTVTTPVTVTTYSDGSTTSADGTPVTTTSTTNVVTQTSSTTNEIVTTTVRDNIVQSASSDQKASVSAVGLKDALAVRNFNPFLVDVLSTKDGAWATPLMGYAKTEGGSFNTSSIGFGAQKTFENNTLGIAGTFGKSDSKNFLNSESNSDSYGATAYALNKQNAIWTKVAVGFSSSEYTTNTSLPIFALTNSSKVKANNYYADLTFYSGKEFYGFRPLVGVTLNKSGVVSKFESGSPLLSTLPEKDSSFEARPYAGIRYDIDWFAFETRVTQSKDFNTVGQVRATLKKEVFKNVSVDVTGGFDKSSNYTAAVGMVGLKINF
jgi:hypothetical protein